MEKVATKKERARLRKHRIGLFLFTVFFPMVFSPSSVFAWGAPAHRIIAHVAVSYLSPSARQSIATLSPTHTLADLANEADRWRETRPETSTWHYVNIPFAASAYEATRDCLASECVVAAITSYETTLAATDVSSELRLEALTFLVHLIADAHQPLHCINNNDRGGNDVRVTFFGQPTNLHAVWDSGLLARTRLGEQAYVHRLRTWLASQDLPALQNHTIIDWVNEAHALAQHYAYHLLGNHDLRSAYYAATLPIVDQQLAKAAVRLARVLNQTLSNPPTNTNNPKGQR